MLKRFFVNANSYVRKIILGISDTHGLYEQGLMNPETKFYDSTSQEYYLRPLNPVQERLWYKVFEPGIASVSELANDDEIVVLHGGDIVHGNKYPDGLLSNRIHDQFQVAKWLLRPVLDLPNVKTLRIASGTPAHSFGSDTGEVVVAMWLQDKYPDKDIRATTQREFEVNGYKIELFHHGPSPGRRKHTKGNVARAFLLDRMEDAIEEGEAPADLYLCGHYHEFVEVTQWKRGMGRDFNGRLIIMPPMCTFGDWGRQALKSLTKVEVGMVAIETIDGKYHSTHKFTQTIKLTGKEKLC